MATKEATTDLSTEMWTEIEAISDQIRRALECPICLMLAPDMRCFCPNGHALCHSCMIELWNRNLIRHCPMCRSPMVTCLEASSVMTVKITEIMATMKLACTYRKFGCKELYYVYYINEHERVCAHKPNIWCLVSSCQWEGVYDQLYKHVSHVHPNVYVETTKNRLSVDNINEITSNRRLTYLVRSPSGLFWVVLSRIARSRIRTGVFMVNINQSPGTTETENTTNAENVETTGSGTEKTSQFGYRVTLSDTNKKSRTRCRTKWVGLSSSLNEDLRGGIGGTINSYTVIRYRSGPVEFNWFPHPIANSRRISSQFATPVITTHVNISF